MGKDIVFFKKISSSLIGTFSIIISFVFFSKFISVYLGPAILVIFSQSRDLVRLTQQLISLNGSVSVVQYLSRKDLAENTQRGLGSLISYSRIMTIIMITLLAVAYVFGFVNHYLVIGIVVFTLSYRRFFLRHIYLLVLGRVRSFYTIQASSLLGAILSSIGIYYLSNSNAIMLLSSFWMIYGLLWFFFSRNLDQPESEKSRVGEIFQTKLYAVARDSLLMLVFGLVTMISVRWLIVFYKGPEYGGYFDAGWSISVFYMSIVFNALVSVLIPEFSSVNTLTVSNLRRPLVLVIALAIIGSILLFSFNQVIVGALYSSEFTISMNLVKKMAPTEVIRAVSWFFGVVLLSKGFTKQLLIAGAFYNIGLLLAVGLPSSIDSFSISYLLINLIYLFVILWYVNRLILPIHSFVLELMIMLIVFLFLWFLI